MSKLSDMIRFHSGQEPEAVFTIAHAFNDDIREIGDVDAGKNILIEH